MRAKSLVTLSLCRNFFFAFTNFQMKVAAWARLGQSPCGPNGLHDFEYVGREQRCRLCRHLFVNADTLLDTELEEDRVSDLMCMSPRQQTCAMDDTFLEDLDQANNRTRRVKRQYECLNHLQPQLAKYDVSHQPSVIKFKNNLKGSLSVLFPKNGTVKSSAASEAPPVPEVFDDILICVKFERSTPHALMKTIFSLPPSATISDVLEAVAMKLTTTVEELHAEFSPRDLAGAFLGLDDLVRETVVLRSRSLSL